MTQALYRKWRPRKWEKVVAQDHVIQTLRNAIQSERVAHAYLFSGPRGTGKTTTARLLAKAVNCLSGDLANRPCDECTNCRAVNEGRFLDLIEIDAASNTSVEDVRDLRDRINYSPSDGRYKVYIIDEVHMLSTAAFNALLKTLEEPPAHAIFILATTEVHKIPATVLSRCQRHEFRRIPVLETTKTLREICDNEGIEADEEALLLIARQSTGAMRDAISLLDQLASTGRRIDLELAQTVLGTATNELVFELIDALLKNDPALGMVTIHKALDGGSDPRQFARQIVEYLRNLLLIRMGNEKAIEATKDVKNRMRGHSEQTDVTKLIAWIGFYNDAISDLRTSWQPSLALEVAFARCIHPDEQVLVTTAQPRVEVNTIERKPVTAPVDKPVVQAPVDRQTVVEQPGAKRSRSEQAPEKPLTVKEPVPQSEEINPEKSVTAPDFDNSASTTTQIATQDVLAAWSRIRAEVKLRRSQAEALLNSQRMVQVKNGVLVLGFQSETVKSKMENPENIEVTQRVIRNIFNVDLPIQCVVVTSKGSVEASVDPDGLVSTALNLGGKLVHRD